MLNKCGWSGWRAALKLMCCDSYRCDICVVAKSTSWDLVCSPALLLENTNTRQISCKKHPWLLPVPLKWDSITAEVLLQVCYVCRKTSNFIFLMIIKNTASPTTGLCTSQKALSWLSRIFRSILSLFLSTLGKKRRAELFWQSWSQPGMSQRWKPTLLVLLLA